MTEVVLKLVKEALQRASGVVPVVGAMASIYTPTIYVWGEDRKIVKVPTDKLSEGVVDDFLALADEDKLDIIF